MKRIYQLTYNHDFVYNDTLYSLYSTPIRVSATNIVCLCVNKNTLELVELSANLEVEPIND